MDNAWSAHVYADGICFLVDGVLCDLCKKISHGIITHYIFLANACYAYEHKNSAEMSLCVSSNIEKA